jgi:quercetin dioxygenase-like cupin family protein
LIVQPGQGRLYAMGRMSASFKADGEETGGLCSVSEWRLEPRTRGPGAHANPEDHVFRIIAGVLSVLCGEVWHEAPAGAYVLIPGGVLHHFENRGEVPAAFIAFNTTGGFEMRMPEIAAALSAENLAL